MEPGSYSFPQLDKMPENAWAKKIHHILTLRTHEKIVSKSGEKKDYEPFENRLQNVEIFVSACGHICLFYYK